MPDTPTPAQTRAEAVRALIEKVEAGPAQAQVAFARLADDDWSAWGTHAAGALHGSLDAAKALHEALLPGWSWCGGSFSASMTVYPPTWPGEDFECEGEIDGEDSDPARAWLLAVLRAHLTTLETDHD